MGNDKEEVMTVEPFDLPKQLRSIVTREPDSPAVFYKGTWLPWSFLSQMMVELESQLERAAIPPGSAVGLICRNRPEVAAAAIALVASNRCVVPISPFNADRALAESLSDIRSAVILAGNDDWARTEVATAAEELGFLMVSLSTDAGKLATVRERRGADVAPRQNVLRKGDAIDQLTSGTTGPPHRISITCARLERQIAAATRHYRRGDLDQTTLPESPELLTMPILHGGMWTLMSSVAEGRKIALLEKFDAREWAGIVRDLKPKAASLNPTAMRMVLDAEIPREWLGSLRVVRSGTAPLPPDTQHNFEETYGIPVLPLYGATEFGGAAAGWNLEDHRRFGAQKIGSVGKALPGVTLRVVATDTTSSTPTGEGLLEVRIRGGDWLRTNDVATIDDDGFVWILGRADDFILRGGFKIDPKKLERLLESHADVREAAVMGVSDERLGSIPVAVLVLKENSTASSQEVSDWVRQHAAPYEVPARVIFTDEIPRTVTQKIDRRALQALIGATEEQS